MQVRRRLPTSSALALAGMAAVFLALVWTAAGRKCDTVDEGLFIGGGVAQVLRGNPNIELSTPPATRWLAGVSAVLLADADLPSEPPFVERGAMNLRDYRLQEVFDWAHAFLHEAEPGRDHHHDRVLRYGRLPFALLAVLLAVIVFAEARRRFGSRAALLAAALLLFTPEIMAHAQWAHSDLAAALSVVLVSIVLARAAERPGFGADVLLGAALALALSVKFTAIVLLPLALLPLILAPGAPDGRSPAAWVGLRLLRIALVVYAGTLIAWLPRPDLLPPHPVRADDVAYAFGLDAGGTPAGAVAWLLTWLPLPDTLLKGLVYRGVLTTRGQVAFLCGETSYDGWLAYFPIAVALKYPTTTLIVALAGCAAFVRRRDAGAARELAWTLPPLVLWTAAMLQPVDIGVRNVLFVAPYFALWAAAALGAATALVRRVAYGLVAVSVLSGLLAWPHLLAYFNPLAGGIARADRYLADSNYDWGQDLPLLADELDERGIRTVRIAYFGGCSPEHHGIRRLDPIRRAPGYYAISRTYLCGMWPPGDPYGWLREIEPEALIGGSIALVRVTAADVARADPIEPRADIDARMRDGAALQRWAEFDAAAAEYRAVLERMPSHYGAHYQLARSLDRGGARLEALRAWRAFLPMAERSGDTAHADWARRRIAALAR